MQVIELKLPFKMPKHDRSISQVLAIGHFDGVHMGHREVALRAIHKAKELNRASAIMTFSPHPREVLGLSKYQQILTPLADKLELFRQLGFDYTYVVAFDKAFSELSPKAFIDDILLQLGVDSIIVGFDFTFGRGGAGTTETLTASSEGRYSVEIVRPFHSEGRKISSTLIRESIQAGRIKEAGELLGRLYSVSGIVVPGDARGRTIGFPTANVELDAPYVVPVNGVYAVWVHVQGKVYQGVMNIGVKPTFTDDQIRTLEVHLLDFHDMIYEERVRVEFADFLREERKFTSVDELIGQIQMDIKMAEAILTS